MNENWSLLPFELSTQGLIAQRNSSAGIQTEMTDSKEQVHGLAAENMTR